VWPVYKRAATLMPPRRGMMLQPRREVEVKAAELFRLLKDGPSLLELDLARAICHLMVVYTKGDADLLSEMTEELSKLLLGPFQARDLDEWPTIIGEETTDGNVGGE
jgi:hypothetical protein